VPERFVVVDVETTGVPASRNHRVVEIGIVVLDGDGNLVEEFETLVNPQRDMGPTWIHRIAAGDVLSAPTFQAIVGDVNVLLSSASLICGHNARFDWMFLNSEYRRLGLQVPDVPLLCTLRATGLGSLSNCCQELGIDFDGTPHHAISDARATAGILRFLIQNDPVAIAESRIESASWPALAPSIVAMFPRSAAAARDSAPPQFLARIAATVRHDTEGESSNALAYMALLDRVLEDRVIDADEGQTLLDAAVEWQLSLPQIDGIHRQYIESLVVRALADCVITESERRDLSLVAKLLGQDSDRLNEIIEYTAQQLAQVSDVTENTASQSDQNSLFGKSVCFTGQLLCSIAGNLITRDLAEELAKKAGLQPCGGVTKKLDLLVVADPNTQSGKAKKARDYGTRVLADSVFWDLIGVKVD
jgi:DNA polymerase III subunit epsilon